MIGLTQVAALCRAARAALVSAPLHRRLGVYSTAVGYAGGHTKNPTYSETCTGRTGHTEAVLVAYNPELISYADLLRQFWECHDPTQYNGQGGDHGTQYRTAAYAYDDEQLALLHASKAAYSAALSGREIHTEIKPISEAGPFYYAHEGYQQYLARPGSRQYCSAQPQGVSLPPFDTWAPAELRATHAPKLSEAFWRKHGPKPHCSIKGPNEQIVWDEPAE